jgi:hypothetical protein
LGQEQRARLTLVTSEGETSGEGKALLETSELIFRGDLRLRIAFSEITELNSAAGRLSVTWPGGTAVLDLGADAEKWAEKIRNPRGLLDKLGVKAGIRVCVIGLGDRAFMGELERRGVTISSEQTGLDLVFFAADRAIELARLAEMRDSIIDSGAIWVVSRKGKEATLRDVDVIAAAKQSGLVDTKVVSFSATHTALKLVIPVANRRRQGPASAARNA